VACPDPEWSGNIPLYQCQFLGSDLQYLFGDPCVPRKRQPRLGEGSATAVTFHEGDTEHILQPRNSGRNRGLCDVQSARMLIMGWPALPRTSSMMSSEGRAIP